MRRGKIGSARIIWLSIFATLARVCTLSPFCSAHIWCALVRPTQSCQMTGQVLATISSHNIQQEKWFVLL